MPAHSRKFPHPGFNPSLDRETETLPQCDEDRTLQTVMQLIWPDLQIWTQPHKQNNKNLYRKFGMNLVGHEKSAEVILFSVMHESYSTWTHLTPIIFWRT